MLSTSIDMGHLIPPILKIEVDFTLLSVSYWKAKKIHEAVCCEVKGIYCYLQMKATRVTRGSKPKRDGNPFCPFFNICAKISLLFSFFKLVESDAH